MLLKCFFGPRIELREFDTQKDVRRAFFGSLKPLSAHLGNQERMITAKRLKDSVSGYKPEVDVHGSQELENGAK